MGISQHLRRSRRSLAILPAAPQVSKSPLRTYPLETRFRDCQYEKKTDRGELYALESPRQPRRLVRVSRFPHPRVTQRLALHRRMIRVSGLLPSVLGILRIALTTRVALLDYRWCDSSAQQ